MQKLLNHGWAYQAISLWVYLLCFYSMPGSFSNDCKHYELFFSVCVSNFLSYFLSCQNKFSTSFLQVEAKLHIFNPRIGYAYHIYPTGVIHEVYMLTFHSFRHPSSYMCTYAPRLHPPPPYPLSTKLLQNVKSKHK